ncbi:hypothetical protein MKW92_025926 [Papaver armeniacum]|nr:hypothetical protein MKW92_025926 [Papaver armeniacum]
MESPPKKVSMHDVDEAGLLQSKELNQYILETSVYPNEAEVLKELRDATSAQPQSFMICAGEEGPILSLLLKLVNAKRLLKLECTLDTHFLSLLLHYPKMEKFTIAIDPDRSMFEVGLPFFKKAGVQHKVEFIESVALPVLDKLLENPANEGSFDFAFVDADKQNYVHYHERVLKLVRVGGMILYDNTLWGGTVAWKDDSGLDEFMKEVKDSFVDLNKKLASDSRIQISQLPVGDGLTICMRLH